MFSRDHHRVQIRMAFKDEEEKEMVRIPALSSAYWPADTLPQPSFKKWHASFFFDMRNLTISIESNGNTLLEFTDQDRNRRIT